MKQSKRRPSSSSSSLLSGIIPDSDPLISSTNSNSNSSNNSNSNSNSNKDEDNNSSHNMDRSRSVVESRVATVWLPLLVWLDATAVSLVVPLLPRYYVAAGVTSANDRELLSSVFSSSQIVGGLVLGVLSDGGVLSKKTILQGSFVGSALSYGMVAYSSHQPHPAASTTAAAAASATSASVLLVVSRVVVGLIKQTVTVTTAMVVGLTETPILSSSSEQCKDSEQPHFLQQQQQQLLQQQQQKQQQEQRTRAMGRLQGSLTVAWIVGPSVGGLLYHRVHPSAPALVACGLFGICFLISCVCGLPSLSSSSSSSSSLWLLLFSKQPKQLGSGWHRHWHDRFRLTGLSSTLASAMAAVLLHTWISRATSYSSLGRYYEDRYGMEPHQRGFVSSYFSLLTLAVQSLDGVGWVLGRQLRGKRLDERSAAALASAVAGLVFAAEAWTWLTSTTVYLLVLVPLLAVSGSVLALCLRTHLTAVAPVTSIHSVLATTDVLQNAAIVTVPFYRTFLYRHLRSWSSLSLSSLSLSSQSQTHDGEPDPVAWVACGALHWAVLAVAVYILLPSSSSSTMPQTNQTSSSSSSKVKPMSDDTLVDVDTHLVTTYEPTKLTTTNTTTTSITDHTVDTKKGK